MTVRLLPSRAPRRDLFLMGYASYEFDITDPRHNRDEFFRATIDLSHGPRPTARPPAYCLTPAVRVTLTLVRAGFHGTS